MAKSSKKAVVSDSPYDDSKWRAEDDLRTLVSAQEIRADKKRYSAAMDVARSKIESMKKIPGVTDTK